MSSSAAGQEGGEGSAAAAGFRFVDIGANLCDDRFTRGVYRGTKRHDPDLSEVFRRAREVGVRRIILTAGTVEESREALEMARAWNDEFPFVKFSSTVGVHPTRCSQVFLDAEKGEEGADGEKKSPDELLDELLEIATDGMRDGTVVAIGEIGLDYDRLEFCPEDVQKTYLVRQLQSLAEKTKLPLFLHNRSVGSDLYEVLKSHRDCWKEGGGVVHTFDDSLDLAEKFIGDLGLYIGLNGCSLKTEDNLDVVKELPLDRLLLETDCPYCEIRPTHAGFQYVETKFEAKAEKKFEPGKCVKNRQEPCHIVQVAEVVAGAKSIPRRQVADACYDNAMRLYRWKD